MPDKAHAAAFVTGASGGIGAALARHLAKRGVKVALAARSAEKLDELAAAISKEGGEAHPYPLDVADTDAVRETMERADDDLGGIDLVVANAGVANGRWSGKLRYEDCEEIIDVNVRGAVATLLALTPRMVERKRGQLVGISSIAQYRGLPKFAAYSASKAFLSHFLESMRVDLRGVPIAVTDIRPGYVRTGLTGTAKPPLIMGADEAAARIYRAIAARKSVHTFPLPIALGMGVLRRLPNGVYDRVAKYAGPG